jgi:ribosomal protein S5
VPEAIRKATEEAKKSMIRVPLREAAPCTTTATAAGARAR